MNFMEAKTQISDLANKKVAILEKAANVVASAIIDRATSKGINGNNKQNTLTDVYNLIDDFSLEERQIILAKALVIVASNGKFGNNTNNGYDDDDYSDMFGRGSIFNKRR